jgi:hypothetical protein
MISISIWSSVMHFQFFDFRTAALKTVYSNKLVYCKFAPTHYNYGRCGVGTLQWRGTLSSGYDVASLGTWFPTFRDGVVVSPSTVKTPTKPITRSRNVRNQTSTNETSNPRRTANSSTLLRKPKKHGNEGYYSESKAVKHFIVKG